MHIKMCNEAKNISHQLTQADFCAFALEQNTPNQNAS